MLLSDARDDKIVSFSFPYSDEVDGFVSTNDCEQIKCYPRGNAFIGDDGSMHLDGDGDYCEVTTLKEVDLKILIQRQNLIAIR